MKFKLAIISLIWLLAASCKKDNIAQQAQITFDLNGSPKTFTAYTNALTTYDTLGVQQKNLSMASPGVFSGPALTSGIILAVTQNLSLPGAGNINLGAYKDAMLNANCISSVYNSNCNGFYFTYYDGTLGNLNTSTTDTTGVVNITSFSATTNQVSGTFSCQLSDHNGLLYQVTEGKFSNVVFVNQ